jgi:hypothetical protein
MRRGSQIDSAVFRQVLPNGDVLDAVEEAKGKEARIANRIVAGLSERAESRRAAKILYQRWLKIIKEAELTQEFRSKAESFWDLIDIKEGLREKWLVDEFYDNPGVSAFWYDNSEDYAEQDRLREMLEDDVNQLLLRMKVIGPRAKGRL